MIRTISINTKIIIVLQDLPFMEEGHINSKKGKSQLLYNLLHLKERDMCHFVLHNSFIYSLFPNYYKKMLVLLYLQIMKF